MTRSNCVQSSSRGTHGWSCAKPTTLKPPVVLHAFLSVSWVCVSFAQRNPSAAVATTILKRAAGVAGSLAVGSRFQICALRCDEKLPSGKNVWDRFGLDQARCACDVVLRFVPHSRARHSSLFFVGNGEAPESVRLTSKNGGDLTYRACM